jgi:hypothetical protein
LDKVFQRRAQEPSTDELIVSPEGHYRGTEGIDDHVVYVAVTADGRQETLTPAEFEAKYVWKNDPTKVRLVRE